MKFKLPKKIKSIQGEEPHPDYNGWNNFIQENCELRDEYDGVQFFGVTNCNYIVFPCGTLIQNFGFHGDALMNNIRKKSKEVVLEKIRKTHAEIDRVLERLKSEGEKR